MRNLSFGLFICFALSIGSYEVNGQIRNREKPVNNIQIALLLDISGSMDQLILKAKSQFWRIANYLKKGRKGRNVNVEVALITYGGVEGDTDQGYIMVRSNLTSDLDSISDKLFEIIVGGSQEFCWTALDVAITELDWSKKKNDLKIILIAGNESFHQGPNVQESVIKKARKKRITINTVYCNAKEHSIGNQWRDAAHALGGDYFMLSLEDSLHIDENFLDNKLIDLNDKLNSTYIPYGIQGNRLKENMIKQDRNYKLSGMPFFRERVAFKIQESFDNSTWDLVDAVKLNNDFLKQVDRRQLPTEINSYSETELEKYLRNQDLYRGLYREAIHLRCEIIARYLGNNKSELENAVKEIVKKQGKKRGFVFKE